MFEKYEIRGNLRLHLSQRLLSTKQGEKLKAAAQQTAASKAQHVTTATFNAWHETEIMEHLLNVKTCCCPRTSFVMWPLLLMLLFRLMRKKKSSLYFPFAHFFLLWGNVGFHHFVTHHLTLANYDWPIVNYITQCLTLIQTSVFWRSINPIAEWCAMWGEKKKKDLERLCQLLWNRDFFFFQILTKAIYVWTADWQWN